MPIVHFHLADQRYDEQQCSRLLELASETYAEVLNCPLERVRVYLQFYATKHLAVAGKVLRDAGADAPYFHFLVLEGRPLEERHRLLARFTQLLVDVLGADPALIRGACCPVHPEDWSIAGTPASLVRAREIAARAALAGVGQSRST